MRISDLITESAYSAGFSDGKRGQQDPRASSKYGPEMNDYARGYADGLEAEKEEKKKRSEKQNALLEPFKDMDDQELLALEKDLLARKNEIADIAEKKRGASFSFDPKKHSLPDDLKQENRDIVDKLRLIDTVKFKRGIKEQQGTNTTAPVAKKKTNRFGV